MGIFSPDSKFGTYLGGLGIGIIIGNSFGEYRLFVGMGFLLIGIVLLIKQSSTVDKG